MDYLLELATLLLRPIRDEKSRSAHTPALDELRMYWQRSLRSLPDDVEASALPRSAVNGMAVGTQGVSDAAQTDTDRGELLLRAPDVLAVEALADVLSKSPHLIPTAMSEAGITAYPVFLEYLVRSVSEYVMPGGGFSPWKWISAYEHLNLLSDRREAVAKILLSTDSWFERAPPASRSHGRASEQVVQKGPGGGSTASMFGTGEMRTRANQLKEQCAEAAKYIRVATGMQAQEWHAVTRFMKDSGQREQFLAALRSELLRKPDLVRSLTDTTAVAVPFTTAFDAELREIRESRRARGAPPNRAASHPLRNAAAMELFGVALSGGGVRSATFNLGVLQALAHLGILTRVDYLSTVSGGGYIGAWLTSWSKRLRDHGARGIVAVESRLRDEPVTEPDAARVRALRFLREYSNYLTPPAGFFTADTWTMLAIWLRNTLLNQAVLGLALCAMLAVPWLLWFLQYKLAEPVVGAASTLASTCASGLFGRSPVQMTAVAALLLYSAAVSGFQLRRFWFSPSERLRVSKDMLGQLGVLFEIVTPVVAASALLSSALFEAIDCAKDAAFAGPARMQLGQMFLAVSAVVAVGGHYAKCFFADRVSTTLGWIRWSFIGAYGAIIVVTALLAASVTGAVGIVAALQGVAAFALDKPKLSYLFVTFGTPTIVGVLSLMIVMKIGILGRNLFDEHREWWSRLGAWLAIVSLGWLGICAVSFYSPSLPAYAQNIAGKTTMSIGGVLWAAWTAAGVILGKRPSTGGDGPPDATRRVQNWILAVAPYVFVLGLLMLVAMVTFRVITVLPAANFGPAHVHSAHHIGGQHWHWLLALPPGLLLLAFVLSWRVDVNEFSMHHFYKNRLVRCYLGASRDERMTVLERAPDPFTGFDSGDDLKVAYLRYTPGGDSKTREAKRDDNRQDVWRYVGPVPIINAALNLVKGDDLAWQERKAQSFTFTPFFSGYNYRHRGSVESRHAPFGFRSTSVYGYPPFGIGLGTAVAISGAAANPNMGHQSSPAAAFLMTMFNARLGWWMGNPRDKHNWLRSGPRRGLLYLLNELFSLTNDRTHFVNLSDGGHFENLGIYELIRRRCRYIIACDAEQDGALTFSGLGNAIRKCRIDFGAEISVRSTRIRPPDATATSALHCVVGDITYANGDRGTLLYLKSSVTGDEPADILEYKSREPAFPHHSTLGDQFFDESQFESYRKLGFHVAHTALAPALTSARAEEGVPGIPRFSVLFQHLREYWHPPNEALDTQRRAHTDSYDALLQRIMSAPAFNFIDAAFFAPPPPAASREQVLMGALMLDLMQRVVLDLELDTDRDHPHNTGWLAIFQRWKAQPAVQMAWDASRDTYSHKFRWFYQSL